MGRKRKTTQHHKFKKLRKKTSKPRYASLRKDSTINPEKIMTKVWERLGKSLDQRMLHDVYKIIDEFLLEKIFYEGEFKLKGFGTLQLIDSGYPSSGTQPKLFLKFIPDSKLKDKNEVLKKEIL